MDIEIEVEMDIPTNESRIEVEYSPYEVRKITRNQTKWNSDIDQMKDDLNEMNKPLFYPNHESVSLKTNKSLQNKKKVVQIIIGRTQSGKTSGMLCIIDNYINNNVIDTDNIFIITGLSSRSWVLQTKKRMPTNLHKNIFHNGQLKNFKKNVHGKKNILLLIDEAHMASKDNQTINNILNDLGWTLDYMLENDIKLIFMTATPDGIAFAMKKWPSDRYDIHIMQPGEIYYGTSHMLERGKLLEAKDLDGTYNKNNKKYKITNKIKSNWCEILKNHLSFSLPKYLIIRLKLPYDKNNYMAMFKYVIKNNFQDESDLFSTKYKEYSMDGDIEDLNECLQIPPLIHTIIFVKSKLMCSDTIIKTNIGSMVDRPTKNCSCAIQSFAGRACNNGQHDIFVYANVVAVKEYEKMWDKEFNDISSIPWTSNTTKVIRGETVSKKLYASSDIRGADDPDYVTEHIFKSIPVKVIFDDNDYRKKLFAEADRTKFNSILLEGITQDFIRVDDKNITKFQTCESLYSIRNYKNGQDKSSRRFKGFKNAYNENKPMSQKCPQGTYCIDIASDVFELDGFTNPVNVGWITFM